jgi:integrase
MLPRIPEKEMKILDEDQVTQFLIAAKGSRYEALLHLAVTTGMRQMELLGLKWEDLDWNEQTIRVERQLERPRGEGTRFSAPKTRHGRQTLTLGRNSLAVLAEHRTRQRSAKEDLRDQWTENGLIFPNSIGGAMDPRNLLRDFKKLVRQAGLPDIRFHDLRNTCASLLLNLLRVPVIEVSRRLGHSRASITLDIYGHLIPGMQTHAAQLIDDLVSPVELHQKRAGSPMFWRTTPIYSPKQEENSHLWGFSNGRNRTRTCDLFCVREAL